MTSSSCRTCAAREWAAQAFKEHPMSGWFLGEMWRLLFLYSYILYEPYGSMGGP